MIKFGTDGWRGIIADDFTFENVRIVTQAICDYILSQKHGSAGRKPPSPPRGEDKGEGAVPLVIIGYDTRFLSDKFARAAAEVVAGNGVKVLMTDTFAPTPAVSYAVVDRGADGAIMITASHNPYRFNGLKFKAPYGGSASPEITALIENNLVKNKTAGRIPQVMEFNEAASLGFIEMFDPKGPYLKHLSEIVDIDKIESKRIGVVVDPMYGAGRGYLSDFLRSSGCHVLEINDFDEPYFGHFQPEPLAENLGELMDTVCGEWPVGIGLDGDADRVGAVDFLGDFVNPHVIIALLLRYLYEEKGMSGTVVKTVSTTGLIDILAAEYGLTVNETPIGFKHICGAMLTDDVLIGGEESGGIGVKGHIPERDGILMGALLVEMMSHYEMSLGELWRNMQKKYGRFSYSRADIKISKNQIETLGAFLSGYAPAEILSVAVESVNSVDGFKFCLADKSWVMVRPSGTEPVVRIYAEAATDKRVAELIAFGRDIAAKAGPA